MKFIDSQEAPTGLVELALPPMASELANAIYAVTGCRIRKLSLMEYLI